MSEGKKESGNESPKESHKEAKKDSVKGPKKESSKESQKDSKKESSKESKKESSKESQKESKKESPKESQKDSPRENLKGYTPRLLARYKNEIIPSLRKRFGYSSVMQVPRLVKIVLNMGVGDAVTDPKFLEAAVADLTTITGQKVVVTKAKKSISNFKIREGMSIGCSVILRRYHMYEFLDRFANVAVPRIRDFRGLEDKGFDGRGNYTLGVREQIIFPEINYDKVLKIRGLNVTFVTSGKTDEEAFELLREFGLPFKKREKAAAA
jgi:large subunit ribosomal protein L5